MNLHKNTTIPLWSVLTSIPVAAGFVVWLTTIDVRGSNLESQIVELKVQKDKEYSMLQEIRDRLIKLEVQINKQQKGVTNE